MICLFFKFGQILKFLHLLIARSPKNPMETLATLDGRRQFQGDTHLALSTEEDPMTYVPDGAAAFLNQRWLDYTGLALEQALG